MHLKTWVGLYKELELSVIYKPSSGWKACLTGGQFQIEGKPFDTLSLPGMQTPDQALTQLALKLRRANLSIPVYDKTGNDPRMYVATVPHDLCYNE